MLSHATDSLFEPVTTRRHILWRTHLAPERRAQEGLQAGRPDGTGQRPARRRFTAALRYLEILTAAIPDRPRSLTARDR
jgi:hypothetical protein